MVLGSMQGPFVFCNHFLTPKTKHCVSILSIFEKQVTKTKIKWKKPVPAASVKRI